MLSKLAVAHVEEVDTLPLGASIASMQGGRGGGAMHISADADGWYIAPGSAGPQTFFVVSETDTITGTGGPPFTVTFTNENMDTGIAAVAGHYSAQTIFGTSAPPGTNFEIQVVQIPGR